jgi:hypothetical protein
MASSLQLPHLAAIFSHSQQAQIGQIVNTKISELISSGGLVCLHCSNCSSNQSPWSPENSTVLRPTALLQGFDRQLKMFDYRLSEQATKLQQLTDDRSGTGANDISSPLTNTIAANPSTSANLVDEFASVEQRLTNLEYRFDRFESSLVRSSSNYNPKSENVNLSLLEQMHANFETTMSKLHLALKQAIDNQQRLKWTDIKEPSVECSSTHSNVELEKFVCDLAEQTVCAEVNTEQLQSDVNNWTVLHSVAVDRHEVLSTLVSNIGHEHNELAEFVRQYCQNAQLRQTTSSS